MSLKPKTTKSKNFEIKFYEQIISQRPNFIDALISLADVYTKKGFHQQGLAIDKRLSLLKPDDPIIFYNLACSFSLVGESKKSFKTLEKAVSLGYGEFNYILEDPDLENLRKSPGFNDAFNRLRINKEKRVDAKKE